MWGGGCTGEVALILRLCVFCIFLGGGAGGVSGKGVTTKESSKVMSVQRLGILF